MPSRRSARPRSPGPTIGAYSAIATLPTELGNRRDYWPQTIRVIHLVALLAGDQTVLNYIRLLAYLTPYAGFTLPSGSCSRRVLQSNACRVIMIATNAAHHMLGDVSHQVARPTRDVPVRVVDWNLVQMVRAEGHKRANNKKAPGCCCTWEMIHLGAIHFARQTRSIALTEGALGFQTLRRHNVDILQESIRVTDDPLRQECTHLMYVEVVGILQIPQVQLLPVPDHV